jgi:hypothetical protein
MDEKRFKAISDYYLDAFNMHLRDISYIENESIIDKDTYYYGIRIQFEGLGMKNMGIRKPKNEKRLTKLEAIDEILEAWDL